MSDPETESVAARPLRPMDFGDAAPKPTADSTAVRDMQRGEARTLIADYEAELSRSPELIRSARLHYEIARLYEGILADLIKAAKHYAAALERNPEHVPTILGARRVHLEREEYDEAASLYEQEARLCGEPERKAALHFALGRLLEDRLGRAQEAREAYATAAALVKDDPSLLKALEQCDLAAEDWKALARVFGELANAVKEDPRHRAALIAMCARITEVHLENADDAAELYQLAHSVDPQAVGVRYALKRLYGGAGRWRELIDVLLREADDADDPRAVAAVLYRAGRLYSERLGDRARAIAVLERACSDGVGEPRAFEDLARLYEDAGNYTAAVGAWGRLADLTTDNRERLGLRQLIGQLCEERLQDETEAVFAYEAVLAVEPTYVPALRALAPLYSKRAQWTELVQMYQAEADATEDTLRRAVATAKAAEILEKRLSLVEEATEAHGRALQLVPGHPPSFKALVRLYTQASNWRPLVDLYERAADSTADDERAIAYLFRIGELYEGPLSDPGRAVAAYRRVLERQPEHLGAIHAVQRAAEAADRHRDLVSALELEATITHEPDRRVALLHRAAEVLDEHLGARDAALSYFRKVLEIDPDYRPAMASLGRMFHRAGRWDDLVGVYERELEHVQTDAERVMLLHRTAQVWQNEIGKEGRAVDCWRRAFDLDPTFSPVAHELIQALRRRGDWKQLVAITERQRTMVKKPADRAMAAFRLGELYEERVGDPQRAVAAYTEAMELAPAYRPAAEALARMRTELKHWTKLVEALEEDARNCGDTQAAVRALCQAGEVWRDQLHQQQRATLAYEEASALDPAAVAPLLALERLYRAGKQWESLADLYARQAATLSDEGAKVAALRERARLLERENLAKPDEMPAAYAAILELSPTDADALAGIERHAIRSGDAQILARIDARLARSTRDPTINNAYLTRMAESLEAAGDPRALAVYRSVLAADHESRAAMRGVGRLGALLNDPDAIAEAARREAEAVRDPEVAAGLLVKAASVQIDHGNDPTQAIPSLERALELWPDQAQAADRLIDLLGSLGQNERLATALTQAALSSKSMQRGGALWRAVATLYQGPLGDAGGAMRALKRLVKANPDDIEGWVALATAYQDNEQWTEAAEALECALSKRPEGATRREVCMRLAVVSTRLGDTRVAYHNYERVLELDPNDREALSNVARLQLDDGNATGAASTAKRLLRLARTEADQVETLLLLAKIDVTGGARQSAVTHLLQAIMIEGPTGQAASEFATLASGQQDWAHYVQALEQHLSRSASEATSATYHEIARIQREVLHQDDAALRTLEEGAGLGDDDPRLRVEYAARLRQAGRHQEAVAQLQRLILSDVTRADAWRHLARTFQEMGRTRDAVCSLVPLSVLGQATAAEAGILKKQPPRPAESAAGSFGRDRIGGLRVGAPAPALAGLVEMIADCLGKARPPDLDAYGVTSRDRVTAKSNHPLRAVVDRVAEMFGVTEFELYVHDAPLRRPTIENTSPPSIMVPGWVAELSPSQQVFLVAQVMANLSQGLHLVDAMSSRELETLLAALARGIKGDFGAELASAAEFEERAKLIHKGVPRRKRKLVEESAEQYALAPPTDVSRWVGTVRQAAMRAALLASDDLPGSIALLRSINGLEELDPVSLVTQSPVVADLIKIWMSDAALALRAS